MNASNRKPIRWPVLPWYLPSSKRFQAKDLITVAKEEAVNRSQAIRDYYKSNHKATTQEVIDSLAKQGITVNAGLVYAVKGRHNQRVAARKTAKKAAEATAKAKTNGNLRATDMKPEVNKMQAARDYLKANKGQGPGSGRCLGTTGHHHHGWLRPHHQGQEQDASEGGEGGCGRCPDWNWRPRNQGRFEVHQRDWGCCGGKTSPGCRR